MACFGLFAYIPFLPEDAFFHTPSCNPPFKGTTVAITQYLVGLFLPTTSNQACPQKKGGEAADVGQTATMLVVPTAPRWQRPKGQVPAPLTHSCCMRNRSWCQLRTFSLQRGGQWERKQSKDRAVCKHVREHSKIAMGLAQPCLSQARLLHRQYRAWVSENYGGLHVT